MEIFHLSIDGLGLAWVSNKPPPLLLWSSSCFRGLWEVRHCLIHSKSQKSLKLFGILLWASKLYLTQWDLYLGLLKSGYFGEKLREVGKAALMKLEITQWECRVQGPLLQ